MPSLGLMFGDFLTSLGEETSAISLITSCFFSALSFAGRFFLFFFLFQPKNHLINLYF